MPTCATAPRSASSRPQRGGTALDVAVELALAEDLATRFRIVMINDDEEQVGRLLHNPSMLLGLSDAGAHTSQLCDANFATYLLQRWVRELGVLSLEDAVWRLTGQPAQVYGLTGRGRIAPGQWPTWSPSTRRPSAPARSSASSTSRAAPTGWSPRASASNTSGSAATAPASTARTFPKRATAGYFEEESDVTDVTSQTSQQIREQLDHPVIDADGHVLEFMPAALPYLREALGPKLFEQYRSQTSPIGRIMGGASTAERQQHPGTAERLVGQPGGQDDRPGDRDDSRAAARAAARTRHRLLRALSDQDPRYCRGRGPGHAHRIVPRPQRRSSPRPTGRTPTG